MNAANLITPIVLLTITACSSSNGEGEASSNDTLPFPSSFDTRVTSISIDIDKNGTIDSIQRYEYDENGRIRSKTLERDGELVDTTTYTHFDGDLIAIESDDERQEYGYENGQVVSYNYLNKFDDVYNTQTLFLYEGGQLTNTIGETSLYDDDECDLISTSTDAADTTDEPELSITYAGNRVSKITSANGVFAADFVYNANSQLTRITDRYKCDDQFEIDSQENIDSIKSFEYDSAGRLNLATNDYRFGRQTIEVFYDDNGRLSSLVETDVESFSNTVESTTTADYFYNDEGQIVSIDSTTVEPDPGFFITPSYIATIEYESESCVTAVTVDPLKLATIDSFRAATVRNDPLLCTYPLE